MALSCLSARLTILLADSNRFIAVQLWIECPFMAIDNTSQKSLQYAHSVFSLIFSLHLHDGGKCGSIRAVSKTNYHGCRQDSLYCRLMVADS